MSKTRLGLWGKQVLLKAMSTRCLDLFGRLESQSMDLDVMNYFDTYYQQLYIVIREMERNYPKPDMSTNDIDTLFKRLHMNDSEIRQINV